jgi:hypothetical protein
VGDEAARGDERRYTRQIVRLLGEYVALDERWFEAEHGDGALTVVEEMMAALMQQLEGNLGYVVLWEQFLQTPEEMSDALVNVVGELRCQDPAFDEWLVEAWGRYQGRAGEG